MKCTSTGRKCDGYIDEPPGRPQPNHALVQKTTKNTPIAAWLDSNEPLYSDVLTYEPSNEGPPLFFTLEPTLNILPRRALHYFIHQSSKDLTGPLKSEVWREFVLHVCETSPAVQHAIAALSGFHERYTLPEAKTDQVQCWQHYYLAVKGINEFVRTAKCVQVSKALADSTLVAIAIFITIEVLLGNTETAIKHLEGSFTLIRQYLTQGLQKLASLYQKRACILTPPESVHQDLSHHMKDLIGWYSRLDLQVLALFPRRHHSAGRQEGALLYAALEVSQPVPNVPSAALFRLLKHSLYWIRHYADDYKFAKIIPDEIVAVRDKLLVCLTDWYATFRLNGVDQAHGNVSIDPETANLLVVYHLTFLKLTTSLSPLETAFDSLDCQNAFCAILRYCALILVDRQPCGTAVALRDVGEQTRFFFSLESSTIEPLFYMAIKCREKTWRQCALLLLKCAGREGVWNGVAMAKAAEYVISVEQGDVYESPGFCSGSYWEFWYEKIRCEGAYEALMDMRDQYGQSEKVPEEKRVNCVTVDVMCSEARRLEVECGWFVDTLSKWTREKTALTW